MTARKVYYSLMLGYYLPIWYDSSIIHTFKLNCLNQIHRSRFSRFSILCTIIRFAPRVAQRKALRCGSLQVSSWRTSFHSSFQYFRHRGSYVYSMRVSNRRGDVVFWVRYNPNREPTISHDNQPNTEWVLSPSIPSQQLTCVCRSSYYFGWRATRCVTCNDPSQRPPWTWNLRSAYSYRVDFCSDHYICGDTCCDYLDCWRVVGSFVCNHRGSQTLLLWEKNALKRFHIQIFVAILVCNLYVIFLATMVGRIREHASTAASGTSISTVVTWQNTTNYDTTWFVEDNALQGDNSSVLKTWYISQNAHLILGCVRDQFLAWQPLSNSVSSPVKLYLFLMWNSTYSETSFEIPSWNVRLS